MNKSLAGMNGVLVFPNTSFVHFLGDFYPLHGGQTSLHLEMIEEAYPPLPRGK